MAGGRPMPKMGNPRSATCRHCRGPRLPLKGFLFCEICDAPQTPDGQPIRPTWKPRHP